ncbi:acyl-CoA-binding domain-containing protein 4 isoform X2 [Neopsephotus bourkii]|uniref:acyl-CoA-binding domain-containing protein 4 isoform X2 n=1 Tax=Neopsephotus bourkii TaxID=309878 RepID=UPI002AA554EC|nr:acyl-CoA-binding domain-containing protein 4 isoform X2 [Neopsephotus bourkii]
MEDAGCRAQFLAAVQVIQGLPRSGSYRPSYEEMLRFYSYYKQATAGRCEGPRPGFWDPIGRYKWDAWNSLGRMSKEEAMEAYVVEMKKVAQKVIDTVPMDETTEEMFRYFEPLYEVIHDMPRPPEAFFKRKGEPSQDDPASSLAAEHQEDALPREQQNEQHTPGGVLAPATALEGTQATSDSEGDVYCDTVEQMESEQAGQPLVLCLNSGQAGPEPLTPPGAGQGEQGEGRRLEGSSSTGSKRGLCLAGGKQDTESTPELSRRLVVELDACVASTVQALQDDMQQVLERLSELEILTSSQGDAAGTEPRQLLALQAPSPWPLTVSPHTLLFLVTWPFVTQWLLHRWQDRKR